MTQVEGFDDKVRFVWDIAELLRGNFRRHENGQIMLPLLVLRRLDCVLEGTKDAVLVQYGALKDEPIDLDTVLKETAGAEFYNTSQFTLTRLLEDADNLAPNLRKYIAGFSPSASVFLDKYGIGSLITRLDEAELLYAILSEFADLDLHPDRVLNETMGYIFEELLRKFSEMSNETAGEHFTPREVIQVMVNVLFDADNEALTGTSPIRSIYDPACGTGGMLTGAQDYLHEINKDAELLLYGQELNPETWAIARSDMLIKGQDPERIHFGNSFTQDGEPNTKFDYMLANPPFGVDWKKYAEPIVDEHEQMGAQGRFGPGLPRVNDGSLLFLLHMISKMQAKENGGSRIAVVFSGSPLFSGGAGSGESEIRRWILDNDLLEAIVALPDQLFYNTGINTYFWVLSNRKADARKGKVTLIDARGEWSKMKKSLGDKRKYLTEDHIKEISRLYHDAQELHGRDRRVLVLENDDFGYQRLLVERPLRRRYDITEATVNQVKATKTHLSLLSKDPDAAHAAIDAMSGLIGTSAKTEAGLTEKVTAAYAQRSSDPMPPAVIKAIVSKAAVWDPEAEPIKKKGKVLPDPDLRDYEHIPLHADPDDHMDREVRPHVSDAWLERGKTRIGYEIPLTRYFYDFKEPRSLKAIDTDIKDIETAIQSLVEDVTQ